jgi:ribosomal protein S7
VQGALRFDMVYKFTNLLMRGGNRSKAQTVLLRALSILHNKHELGLPLVTFFFVLGDKRPVVFLDNVTRGARSYKVPCPLTRRRSITQSMHWLASIARSRPAYVRTRRTRNLKPKGGRDSKSASERLADALRSACVEEGPFIDRRNKIYHTASQSIAYTDYRWR